MNIHSRSITLFGTLAITGLVVCAGCSDQKIIGNRHKDSTPIQLGDFHGDPNAQAPETTIVRLPRTDQPVVGDLPPTQILPDNQTHTTGSDREPARAAILSGDDGLEFLDAKVGDISGHPIYVSSFFQPIEDRLVAMGQELSLANWRNGAISIVKGRLDGIIYDELLRAETLAALTPQQRVGLQSFIKDFRSNLLSENLGSAQLADRRIQEEQGISLDEALRQKELDTLVGLTLYQEINRGINISWRDIKQRYERDIKRFQPPPTVVLQVIRVLEPEGELVDSLTARLNTGESFAEIASSDTNTFNKDTQGTIETLLEEDFGSTMFFAPAPLNEAVWSLDVGQWNGPISLGNATYWILYAQRNQEFTSLYDAQIQLLRELTQERRLLERKKYLSELIERARVSSRDEILLRLLYIAEQHYGPTG